MTTALQNVRTRQEWAEIINADWRKSIESIIQTGRDLSAARKELPRGEFKAMVESDLPFSRHTAESLIGIADHPIIGESATSRNLPPSWSVLSELAKLSEEDFSDAQEHGLISDKTNARTARAIAGAYSAPEGQPVGSTANKNMLPSPKEARTIARETGRMVSASDGNLYSGATEEEGAEHARKRRQTYGIRDAIEGIATCPVEPEEWLSEAEDHQIHDFTLGSVDAAIDWLNALRPVLAERQKVIENA